MNSSSMPGAPSYTIQGLLGEQNAALERALRVNDDINARLRETLKFNLSITECFQDARGGEPSSSSTTPRSRHRLADRIRLPIGTGSAGDAVSLQGPASDSKGLYEPLISYRSCPHGAACPAAALTAAPAGFTSGSDRTLALQPVGSGVRSESGRDDAEPRKVAPELLKRETQLFPSPAEDIRIKVERSMQTRIYNVENFYFSEGLAQSIARNQHFINLTLAVIMTNTVWIAIDTDLDKHTVLSHAPPIFQIMNNLFCSFFSFEVTMRFFAFRHKMDALRDSWFVFDVLLVLLMVWETWVQVIIFETSGTNYGGGARNTNVLRILRIFRLARIARMARLLRSVPELMILVRGMATAMRSVFATLVLLVIIIYIFALVFTQLLTGESVGEGKFDNVLLSMNFLLVQVTCGFDGDFVTELFHQGIVSYLMFLVFLLIANLTLMNMLIGVLCEVVADVAQQEKEEAFLKDVKAQITRMVHNLDEDGSDEISKEEFEKLVDSPDMMNDLVDLGVDVVSFVEFANFVLNMDGRSLTATQFFDLVIQFRGNKAATVKDIVDMRRFISMEMVYLEQKLGGDFSKV